MQRPQWARSARYGAAIKMSELSVCISGLHWASQLITEQTQKDFCAASALVVLSPTGPKVLRERLVVGIPGLNALLFELIPPRQEVVQDNALSGAHGGWVPAGPHERESCSQRSQRYHSPQ